jgi:hypothetical protein
VIVTEHEIAALTDRLLARGNSALLSDQPAMQADMRLAARILRRFLQDGTVLGYVRLDDDGVSS